VKPFRSLFHLTLQTEIAGRIDRRLGNLAGLEGEARDLGRSPADLLAAEIAEYVSALLDPSGS